jgi:hypothetical protein
MKIFNIVLIAVFCCVMNRVADAKWWIFGQSNEDVSFSYLYLNSVSYEESGLKTSVPKSSLEDGQLRINGRAKIGKGNIGGVRVSLDDRATWQDSKFAEDGTFEFRFRPELGKTYILYVEVTDTAGKINDVEKTRKELTIIESNAQELARTSLDELLTAYRNEDPTRFMKLVSSEFTGDSINLDRAIRKDFSAFDNIDIRYTLNNVVLDPAGRVFVSITFNRSVTSSRSSKTLTDNGATELIFKLEEGAAKVFSMKNPLIFGLSDPESVANGTVNNPANKNNISLAANGDPSLCDTGVCAGGGAVITRSITLRFTSFNSFQGFIFADDDITSETDTSNLTGDFGILIEGGQMAFLTMRDGVTVKDMGVTSLDQIRTADETGYQPFAHGTQGHSYVFKLPNNTYGAIEIINLSAGGGGFGGTAMLRYKYQPNGTRQF